MKEVSPELILESSTYKHVSGLFEFPSVIGSFNRVKVTNFNARGSDIGISYRIIPSSSLAATIYVFPTPKLTDGDNADLVSHYYAEESGIISKTSGTKQISWPIDIPQWSDEGVSCTLSAYDLGGMGTMVSILQLCDYGEWRLKFRLSYHIEDAKKSAINIDELHRLFKWPK
jgi:hypothetical protein